MSQSLIQRCRTEALEQFQYNLKHVNARHKQADLAAKGTQQGIALVEDLFRRLDVTGSEREILERAFQAAQQLAQAHPAETHGHWCQTVLKRAVWVFKSKLPETQQAFDELQKAHRAQFDAFAEQEHQKFSQQWAERLARAEQPLPPNPLFLLNQQIMAEQEVERALQEQRIAEEQQRLLEARQRKAIQQRREREARQRQMAEQRRREHFDPEFKRGIVDSWQRSVCAKYSRDAQYYADKGWHEIHSGLSQGIGYAQTVLDELDPNGLYSDVLDSGLDISRARHQQVQNDPDCNQWCRSVLECTVKFFEYQSKAHQRELRKQWLNSRDTY